jgi:hypothetical protein
LVRYLCCKLNSGLFTVSWKAGAFLPSNSKKIIRTVYVWILAGHSVITQCNSLLSCTVNSKIATEYHLFIYRLAAGVWCGQCVRIRESQAHRREGPRMPPGRGLSTQSTHGHPAPAGSLSSFHRRCAFDVTTTRRSIGQVRARLSTATAAAVSSSADQLIIIVNVRRPVGRRHD